MWSVGGGGTHVKADCFVRDLHSRWGLGPAAKTRATSGTILVGVAMAMEAVTSVERIPGS